MAGLIPEIFRHKKPDESVRVWCMACATGEEAYSMAILLLEHARKLESPPMLQVFGCDLDEVAIQTARAGFYPETIAADVSEERLRSFFVKREVREMVLFAAHDLLTRDGERTTLLSEEAAGGSAQTQDYCRRLMAASNRLDKLILDSLHYTRAVQQEPPRGPVDLSKLIPELIETYPNLSADKADIAIEAGLPVVLANESLVTQCFSNLLGNAVKFVPPGTRPAVRVRAEVKDGRAKIWVEDNGIGIPQNAQARLFQMFQKLDNGYEGTGIGLAIVRKVTERMNGAVGVESEESKGSRFWVELPLALATDGNKERPATP